LLADPNLEIAVASEATPRCAPHPWFKSLTDDAGIHWFHKHHGLGFCPQQRPTPFQRKPLCLKLSRNAHVNHFISGHPPRCAAHPWFESSKDRFSVYHRKALCRFLFYMSLRLLGPGAK